jgi:hypothetical protein
MVGIKDANGMSDNTIMRKDAHTVKVLDSTHKFKN